MLGLDDRRIAFDRHAHHAVEVEGKRDLATMHTAAAMGALLEDQAAIPWTETHALVEEDSIGSTLDGVLRSGELGGGYRQASNAGTAVHCVAYIKHVRTVRVHFGGIARVEVKASHRFHLSLVMKI